jgi:hypothetical protein
MRPGFIPSVLALVGVLANSERARDEKEAIDEVIHPWAGSIVDTPTPPTGPRRIDVRRWEDLLHAAELLGRPILRLHGGEGGADGRLFYVADGPQSYVFGFNGGSVSTAKSGAFAPATPTPTAEPTDTTKTAVKAEQSPPSRPAPAPSLPQPRPLPSPAIPDPADALLGPELFDDGRTDSALPSATVVEQRIREMIHELLAGFRKLPPSSDRLERGSEHIQRAVDMLHLGRYGVAQIELNKANRLLRDGPNP